MSESIRVEVDSAEYELNEELVSWMLKVVLALDDTENDSDGFYIDSSLLQDVRLILDEVEESLVKD